MSNLGQIIRAIQHDAEDLDTESLKEEIIASLAETDEALTCLHNTRQGAVPEMDHLAAVGDVMSSVLVTAMYVRELTTRPVIWAKISAN
jgi:hypothetical protein